MQDMSTKREVWIDWLRVIACFMVMVVHSTEPFYLGGEGTLVKSASDAFWASFMDSLVRACVPIFVVASSYLQFPMHYSSGEFLRRRAVRILIPLAVWSVVYALIWGKPAENFVNLLQNFNYAAGHLWFVYMLVGLYLIIPMLSPWAEKVTKTELQVYIGIWLFTTLIPFIRIWLGGEPPVIYGPSGIPNPARYPLWGECSWNTSGTFYYLSGMIGYLLIGLYFRRFVGELSWSKTLRAGLPCLIVGFAICFGVFYTSVCRTTGGVYPFEGPVGIAAIWETPWMFDSTGVALMTIGTIFLMRKITSCGSFYSRIVLPVSKASYGMYLLHMIILSQFAALYGRTLSCTPLIIILTAVSSYVCVAITAIVLQRIPKVGKYIIG